MDTFTLQLDFDASTQCATVRIAGVLDEVHAPALREELYGVIDRGCRDIILELSAVEAISSVGIGALICAYRRFGEERGRIAVAGPRKTVERVLEMAGMQQRFPVFRTVEEARIALFRTATQVFEPVKENTARLRAWLRTVLAAAATLPAEREAVEAATSEAFANAVQHACPDTQSVVTVRLAVGSAVVIEVRDQGPGFEARQYFNVDPEVLTLEAHGLGIHVMRNLMDLVEFTAGAQSTVDCPAGTTVRLVKRLRETGAAATAA